MAWAYEDIHVDGLGILRLTGDMNKVMASVPEGESLVWQERPFRCHATWLMQDGKLGQSDSWMLGKGREDGLSDQQAAEVRDLVEEAVIEWTSDSEALSMLSANAAQVRLSDAELEALRVRMQHLRELADGTDPYATMDALREVAELSVRVRIAEADKASTLNPIFQTTFNVRG